MKKQCYFKQNGIKHIDYKNTELIEKFMTPHGRMIPARRTAVSRLKQRELAQAVKRARFMGLMPYVKV